MGDRQHQAELRSALAEHEGSPDGLSVLAFVVPGGGKSRLPAIMAQRFPSLRIGWFVPRLSLRRQAEESMREQGIAIREAANDLDPSRGTRGFVATQQTLTENPGLWRDEFKRFPYILVLDEMHHAKIKRDDSKNSLAIALDEIQPLARAVLNMSGTLETNDRTFIRDLFYEDRSDGWAALPEESADIYVRYTRQAALREGAIVPIEFHHGDGPVKFNDGDERQYESLRDVRSEDEAKALFTVLSTQHAMHLFRAGVAHFRASGNKLLVVCDKQFRAKKYLRALQEMGIESGLAIEENDAALTDIKRFRKDPVCKALVTCAMAYEGLDVKEITHIVCLTHIRSVPWIEQMLARAWRSAPGKRKCWAFVPDDNRMNRTIGRIHAEQLAIVPAIGEGPGGDTPPPANNVVAIDSKVDHIRAALLDGTTALSCEETELLAVVQKWGIGVDHPAFVQLVRAIEETRRTVLPGTSVRDEEKSYRDSIADVCRRADWEKGADFGAHQKLLIRHTGKSITAMTLEELKNAASVAARICA